MDEAWGRAKEILLGAVDLSGAERARYLDEVARAMRHADRTSRSCSLPTTLRATFSVAT